MRPVPSCRRPDLWAGRRIGARDLEVRANGVKFPGALRSENLPQVAEIPRETASAAAYAPCWRAREAWAWSARMRSASVPPPSGRLAATAPLLAASLAGRGAGFGGWPASAASIASIGEFGP